MMKNQMFDQMDMAAQERLSGRDPLEIAQNCGAAYDVQKQEFRLSTMGIDLRISWPDCRMVPEIAGWHRLVILHYLDLGDGYPVTLKVWLPDEDFPASGRLLLDESADHYLTIEDAVTVAELLLEKITKQNHAM